MFFMFKNSGVRWIITFLGNPGSQYEKTRHNIGFMVADIVAKNKGVKIDRLRFRALTGVCDIGGERALLLKPQTFMNLSGESVLQASSYHKIAPENILVVLDDVALPVGKIRLRQKGSPGGHNGLKNISEKLKTDNYPRLKVGVGAPGHSEYEMMDWVLGKFSASDEKEISQATVRAADAIEIFIAKGPDAAMNQYN